MVYRFQGRHVFLTYPRCDLTRDQVNERICANFPVESIVVAQEHHEDGGLHLHVFVRFTRKFDSRNERVFDYDEYHPNIQCPRSPKSCYEYCKKADDECIDTFPAGYGTIKRKWGDIISDSQTKDDFLAAVVEHYPRDAALSWRRLGEFCESRYREYSPDYQPTYQESAFRIPECIADWKRANFDHPRPERPKSLVIISDSRYGKTQWARSLGAHVYWNSYYSLDSFDTSRDYIVIDDLTWERIPAWKALFGSQREFVLTDKYRKKSCFKNWGKPAIFCINHDCDYRRGRSRDELRWLNENVVFCELNNKLF